MRCLGLAACAFFALAPRLLAAPVAQPVPGAWKGTCSQPGAEFTLEYDAKLTDGRLSGAYIFSSGPSIVKGSFSGTQTGSNIYAVRVDIPAGTHVPQFNVTFPDRQALAGTLRIGQRQPEFKAAFAGLPDMTLSARLQLVSLSQFSARWVALGLAGTAVFRRTAPLPPLPPEVKPTAIAVPLAAPAKAAAKKRRAPKRGKAAAPPAVAPAAATEDDSGLLEEEPPQ